MSKSLDRRLNSCELPVLAVIVVQSRKANARKKSRSKEKKGKGFNFDDVMIRFRNTETSCLRSSHFLTSCLL